MQKPNTVAEPGTGMTVTAKRYRYWYIQRDLCTRCKWSRTSAQAFTNEVLCCGIKSLFHFVSHTRPSLWIGVIIPHMHTRSTACSVCVYSNKETFLPLRLGTGARHFISISIACDMLIVAIVLTLPTLQSVSLYLSFAPFYVHFCKCCRLTNMKIKSNQIIYYASYSLFVCKW